MGGVVLAHEEPEAYKHGFSEQTWGRAVVAGSDGTPRRPRDVSGSEAGRKAFYWGKFFAEKLSRDSTGGPFSSFERPRCHCPFGSNLPRTFIGTYEQDWGLVKGTYSCRYILKLQAASEN